MKASSARPVLVLTTEPLPVPGGDTTGAGLRAWGLAESVRARGTEVIVACPAYPGDPMPAGDPPHVRRFLRGQIAGLLSETDPSCVVLQHWGLAREVPELSVPLVLDLAGPHLLERLYWGGSELDSNLREKLAAIRRADFITCSGEFQKRYFYPFLLMAGFDIRTTPLPVIPFSVPPPRPPTTTHRSAEFVYTGTLLAWQSPGAALQWALDEMDRAGVGTLHYYGGGHPVLDASGSTGDSLTALLQSHPRVVHHGRLPFDRLVEEISGFTAAIDLMLPNPERELAYSSRTMVYLHAGLPVIHGHFADTGRVIDRHRAGFIVDPADEVAVRRAVRDILDGTADISSMASGAREAAALHDWTRTGAELAEFCRAPHFREGKAAAALSHESAMHELEKLRMENAALEANLATLRGKLAVRVSEKLAASRLIGKPLSYVAACPIAALVYLGLRGTARRKL